MLEITLNFQSNPIRILNLNGSPWFVARDVCDALNLSDCRAAVAELEPDEVYDIPLDNAQRVPALTPGGLFALAGRHRSSEARELKRWIDNEAFPAFFSHGIIEKMLATIAQRAALEITNAREEKMEKEFSVCLEAAAKYPPPIPRKADTFYAQMELPFL